MNSILNSTTLRIEMNAYLEYDPNVDQGQDSLLPCDDPEWSNFTVISPPSSMNLD